MHSSVTIASRVLCACANPGTWLATKKNGCTPRTIASATAPVDGDRDPLARRPQQRDHREHQRQRARVERARDDERLRHQLRRAPPVVRAARARARSAAACARGSRPERFARSDECASSSTNGIRTIAASAVPRRDAAEEPHARAAARAAARTATPPPARGSSSPGARRSTAARRRAPAPRTPRAVGLRTTWSVASSTHGSHAHTLDSGHASQTTWKSPNPATTPASSAAPDALPEPPRQQERPERRHPQLQRADQPQRPPERQHVRRPGERREDRRLHVRVAAAGRPRCTGSRAGCPAAASRV